jgi:hypothetical protein
MFVAVVSSDALYRIWCVNHQSYLLDRASVLAMDACVSGKPWMDQLHDTVKYIRKQSTFIDEIGSKSPYHINVRWSSLGQVVAWYAKHKGEISSFLAEKDNEVGEESVWWLQTLILNVHFDRVCKTKGSIQGKMSLVCEQSACIDDLCDDLVTMYGAEVDAFYSVIGQIDASNLGSVTVLANLARPSLYQLQYFERVSLWNGSLYH